MYRLTEDEVLLVAQFRILTPEHRDHILALTADLAKHRLNPAKDEKIVYLLPKRA